MSRKVIVERAIIGKELECSVMGNQEPIASAPCEILPSREFYDYEDKYLLDRAEFMQGLRDLLPLSHAECSRVEIRRALAEVSMRGSVAECEIRADLVGANPRREAGGNTSATSNMPRAWKLAGSESIHSSPVTTTVPNPHEAATISTLAAM